MSDLSVKGAMTFLLGCIGARLLIAYTAFKLPKKWLPFLGAGAILLALSWIYIYMFNARPFGLEAGGIDSGLQKIWWNEWRPLHAGLYLAFGVMALNKSPNSYKVVLLDTLIGLVSWMHHYYV
jgi:hypothetical protein